MATQSDVRFVFDAGEASAFDVVRFELAEGLSRLFRLELALSSPLPDVDAGSLLDREVRFAIARDGVVEREVHGIVTSFEQGDSGHRRTRYQVVVEPALARLGLWHGSRIHQLQTVPDLLTARLKERGLRGDWRVGKPHQVREYCVQHRETDLAFFARLMAEEGIVWAFDADAHSGVMLADEVVRFGWTDAPVVYAPNPGGDAAGPRVWQFAVRRQLAPTRAVQRDYTFRNPQYSLEHRSDGREAVGTYEHFDAPGRYKRDEAGKPFTVTTLAALRNEATLAQLQGDDARLWPGLGFALDGEDLSDAQRGDWRIVTMQHVGEQFTSQEQDGAEAATGTRYAYTATAVPANTNWQAARPPRPVMDGPQVAHVVGPPNEEIHTDEHGRVMVWFPWDREGPKENSTCWLRVSQGWAGASYGLFALPRIGHEVIVSFLDGDPDQPVITGRTHHVTQRPPYELPLHKTRSTWKTQTHKGDGYNELRFEDAAGQEEIFVHAQRDQNLVVEHDETTRIGHHRTENVGVDEAITIGNDRTETVGRDETLSIGQDRSETLGRDHLLDVGRSRRMTVAKDLIEHVGNVREQKTATDWRIEIGGHVTHDVAGRHETEVGQRSTKRTRVLELSGTKKLVLRGPGGTITLDASGITLDGLNIGLRGSISTDIAGVGNSLEIAGSPKAAAALDAASELPMMRVFPSRFLVRNNVLARAELLDGRRLADDGNFKLGGAVITDFWTSSEGRIYFVPPDYLASEMIDHARTAGQTYQLTESLCASQEIADITQSLDDQCEVLREFADANKREGGPSPQARRDQLYHEGYFRFQQAIGTLEERSYSIEEGDYLSAWLQSLGKHGA